MIRIAVEKRQATVEETELITTGSVGIPVEFGFSGDWDGLSKVAVFRVGDNPDWYDIILDETNACVVPWEILTSEFEGEPVFIGVEGTDRLTNTIVVPTIWVSVGAVKPGAHSGNAESADPTATQWSQIRMLAEQAASDAESAQEAAETAETYVSHTPVVIDDYWNVWDGEKYVPTAQKAKGDDGDPGQDGQDGFSPVVEVEAISGGHTVTITDSTGSDTFNVMDGEDGQTGPPGLAVSDDPPQGDELAWIETDSVNGMELPEINDNVPSNNNTYSSNKIESIKSGIENTLTQLGNDLDTAEDDIDNLETVAAQLDQNMAYVESGNTASRNYTFGQFISWKGTLYTVSASNGISFGQTFSTGTGGNLTAVVDGGLNNLLTETRVPSKIYRFTIENGTVEGIAPLTRSYTPDDNVYVSNNKIKFANSGVALINVHLSAREDNDDNRVWMYVSGGNVNPQAISYGEYATLEITEVTAFTPATEIVVGLNQMATVGGGGIGPSYVHVVLLSEYT